VQPQVPLQPAGPAGAQLCETPHSAVDAVRTTARLYPSALSGGGWYVLAADPHTVGGGYAPPPAYLQPILEELLRGDTDVTTSRRLSMSPRTYSRRVAELLTYLGVRTRFQGGMEVALRGWVPLIRQQSGIAVTLPGGHPQWP
jgi:hypothetical protein